MSHVPDSCRQSRQNRLPTESVLGIRHAVHDGISSEAGATVAMLKCSLYIYDIEQFNLRLCQLGLSNETMNEAMHSQGLNPNLDVCGKICRLRD